MVDLTNGKIYDLAPKSSELDRIPSSLKHLLKATKTIQANIQQKHNTSNNPNNNNNNNNNNTMTTNKHGRKLDHISALPGESLKSFAKRVKTEARKIRTAESLQQAHTLHKISDKRKEFLDRKKGKLNQSNNNDDDDSDVENTNNTNTNSINKGSSGALKLSKDKNNTSTANDINNNNANDDSDYEEPAFGHVIEDLYPKLLAGGSNKRRREDNDLLDDDAILDETGQTMIWKDNKGKIHKTQIKDEVKFGERVMEPPRFNVLPRLSAKQKQRQQANNDNNKKRDLLASQLLHSNTNNNNSTKDRSDIVRAAQIDHARNEAIRAYAELKMRRKDEQSTTLSSTTASGTTNKPSVNKNPVVKPTNLIPYVSSSSLQQRNIIPTSLSSSNTINTTNNTNDNEFTKITLDNFKTKVLNQSVNNITNNTNNLSSSTTTITSNSNSNNKFTSSGMRIGALRVGPRQ